MIFRTFLVLGALAALSVPLGACGQSTTSATTNTSAQTTTAPAPQSPDEAFFARAVMFENFEIQGAAIAAQQGQRQAVKDYAAAEATAHHAALQELTNLAQTNHMAAPTTDLDDNYDAYLDMLRRQNSAGFDAIYESQQALAYINAAGTYEAYASTAADSPLKQWAAARLPQMREGVTNARHLAASN